MRFGSLTVREKLLPAEAAQTRWLCDCDCGKSCVVTSYALRKGKQVSCGCAKIKNITGKRFGSLTVIRRSDRFVEFPSKGRRYLWECRCDCGEIVYRLTEKLRPEIMSACKNCSAKAAAQTMTANAGFVEGTQICKLTSTKPNLGNSSGVRGVFFNNKTQKYRAVLEFQGKNHYLGEYSQLEDAIKARQQAEDQFFAPFLARHTE